ncbi:LIM and calponin homology domains-containing protein 1 isoform X7 [Betta splendens]|uniref:LIM and calponin homology domains-containing protein 1 isoform X7 n=1 Tax=Betta splendens TaxID=158456 RepID=A0A9W2XNQ4_BETSP|nr:LIM and calponin homology domains-containing protein 1 isoform X7 [Betta splendens]
MASPAAGRHAPNASPREEPEPVEPNHPEPACQEAQKWIEAVTGKSFGDKDFRSALENGILLCELLSAIKPGLVKKINRLPTPIAGLDNLSVFLRGCEELGLRGSQLFDPGDLQDTSIRANLKDSDCNRKLKNVLNTVFWLGKAAGGCASYSGPNLNLKEFEGLLAQMKLETEDVGESPQNRSVRDSGYDCWDSERSESLSPPRHTRDNSLDSLDSFGSRSQHSPSPDVVNRVNSEGRVSDSEADAHSRKPDVRKDDMLARRTASSESKSSIPFNQFLPNRANASSYVPIGRRKPQADEGEQRSLSEQSRKTALQHKSLKTVTWAPPNCGETPKQEEEKVSQEVLERSRLQKLEKAGIKVLPAAVRYSSPSTPTAEEQEVRPPSPNIILRRDNDFLSSQKSAWDSSSEEEAEAQKVPDVRRDDLASRRAQRGPVAPRVHQFVPPPVCSTKDQERWEGIRRASQQTLQEKESSEREAVPDIITRRDNPFLKPSPRQEEDEGEEDEGQLRPVPNKQKDDLAHRRAQSRPIAHRDGATRFVSASMSHADMQKWGRLRMTEPSEASPASVCQACLQKTYGGASSRSAKAGRDHGKVVTFGGVTEIERPVDAVMSSEGEETELLRRLLSKAAVAVPVVGLGSRLSQRERSTVTVAAEPQSPSSKAPNSSRCEGQTGERAVVGGKQEGDVKIPKEPVTVAEPPSPSPLPPSLSPAVPVCKVEADLERQRSEDKVEECVEERKRDVNEQAAKKPFWLLEDELPPMMMSRRVTFMSEDTESVSLGDMLNEEEVGHMPQLSQSRYERMHEQYNSFLEDEDHWQNDLARWKNRRRSTSQELIRKEEERKRIEKRMKGPDGKRKSIKTYKEIVEEKERREEELCEAYRNAATPEEAAMVLQRYALRFTISDAILDSLKLPRATSTPRPDLNQSNEEHKPSSPMTDSETSDPQHKSEPAATLEERQVKAGDAEAPGSPAPDSLLSTVTKSDNKPPQTLELNEVQAKHTSRPPAELISGGAPTETNHAPPQRRPVQPHTTQPVQTLPSPSPPCVPPRPVPLLAAKPYCQPKNAQPGHKPVKMDGLVRVNGEPADTSTPASSQHLPQEIKDIAPKHSEKDLTPKQMEKDVTQKQTQNNVPPGETEIKTETSHQPSAPPTEKPSSSSGSAISSLIGGRNCVITTTIVTELTQTLVEPFHPDIQNNEQVNGTTASFGQPAEEKVAQPATDSSEQEHPPTVMEGLEESSVSIETPMLNLAKRVNHWVWDPNEERKRLERWQQEQERLLQVPRWNSVHVHGSVNRRHKLHWLRVICGSAVISLYTVSLQEQYQKEQEKLKKEWEKAQLEVEEEERKHNEEERRILEETVTPLSPTGLLIQPPGQAEMNSAAPENISAEKRNLPPQQSSQRISMGSEDQHASKLHFFQDSARDSEPSKKQELWKTSSLDRNSQLNQAQAVKRSGSYDVVSDKQQSSSSLPQPPSPSRCVSGKRLCSGCSQPLGKGAAMIIDTLGLFFHVHCFKCGVCDGQLGDATAGTDVRIRNGLLSCHECYIASRGRGQPTTL